MHGITHFMGYGENVVYRALEVQQYIGMGQVCPTGIGAAGFAPWVSKTSYPSWAKAFPVLDAPSIRGRQAFLTVSTASS